jgi:lysophospholipase L1-like esterase
VVVSGVVTYDSVNKRATLQPNAPLAYSTTYTATVVSGASGVKDAAGNPLVSDYAWQFTTTVPPPPGANIFGSGAVGSATTDPNAVELGFKFRSDVAGFVQGVRFYKGAGNGGTHKGSLWSKAGALLATATFTSETSSGWQEVLFSSPVAISANTTYVASYFAPQGHYQATTNYFANAGADAPPLHALKNGVDGGNGVYKYTASSSFPNLTFSSTNYWVDVLFSSGAAPAQLSSLVFPSGYQLGSVPVTGAVNLTASQGSPVTVNLSMVTGGLAVSNLPATVVVPAGSVTAQFTVSTKVVSALTPVQITATLSGSSLTNSFNVRPPGVKSLGFAPGAIDPGAAAGGYLFMEAPVIQDTVIDLSIIQSDPSWLILPSSVTVPANSNFGNFGVIASPALAGGIGAQSMVLASSPWRSSAGLVTITGTNPAFNPGPETPGLPRVMIIGDSISIGYTQPTRDLLSGQAVVQRNYGNGGMTTRGQINIDEWLGSAHWDAIVFNFGLWDIEDLPDGSRLVPLAEYKQNLQALITRMKQTGAKLIWCSTTPVPNPVSGPPRSNNDVIAYNAAALQVMQANNVQVVDLYTYILPHLADYQLPNDVHFNTDGYNAMATQVASGIRTALGL